MLRTVPVKSILRVALVSLSLWIVYVVTSSLWLPGRLGAAAKAAGMELTVGSTHSLLPGVVHLTDVHIADAGTWELSCKTLEMNIDVTRWLSGSLEIDRLSASGTRLRVTPPRLKPKTVPSFANVVPVQAGAAGSTPLTIRHAEARGHHLIVGPYAVEGDIGYRLDRTLRLGPKGANLSGELTVTKGRVEHRGRASATVSGTARVELGGASAGQAEGWREARFEIDAQGDLQHIAALLPQAPESFALSDAHYRATLEAIGPHLKTGNLRIQASGASLAHDDGSATRLTGNIELALTVGDGHEQEDSARLSADELELVGADRRTWATLTDVRASLQAPRPDAGTGRLNFKTREAIVRALGSKMRGPIAADLNVRAIDAEGGLELGASMIRTPEARLASIGDQHFNHTFSAKLALHHATLTPRQGLDYVGELSLESDDASLLLDLARASETTRWTLSFLEGQPLRVHAHVVDTPRSLALERVEIQSGATEARGAVHVDESGERGAFLLDGPVQVGLSLGADGIEARSPVPPQWLPNELKKLKDAAAAAPTRR